MPPQAPERAYEGISETMRSDFNGGRLSLEEHFHVFD